MKENKNLMLHKMLCAFMPDECNARARRSAAGPHEPPLRRVPPTLHFAVHPEQEKGFIQA